MVLPNEPIYNFYDLCNNSFLFIHLEKGVLKAKLLGKSVFSLVNSIFVVDYSGVIILGIIWSDYTDFDYNEMNNILKSTGLKLLPKIFYCLF